MATFTTYAEILRPDHPMMKIRRAATTWRPSRYRPAAIEQAMRADPGVVLGDVLQRTGGIYETTTLLTPKFRAIASNSSSSHSRGCMCVFTSASAKSASRGTRVAAATALQKTSMACSHQAKREQTRAKE